MMNDNFIVVRLDEKNRLKVQLEFKLLGNYIRYDSAVIDTGCSYTTIPFRRVFDDVREAYRCKEVDIRTGVKYKISYGVESGGNKHEKPRTFEEKMNCPAMKFEHMGEGMKLGGYGIGSRPIHVNYDRAGNVLIGMDILREFEFCCGESLIEDEENDVVASDYIFIGCLKRHITAEYMGALKKYFGLGERCKRIGFNGLKG